MDTAHIAAGRHKYRAGSRDCGRVDRTKTRISIPRAQPGGRALVLKTAGLAIERRVAPRDRRNGKAIYKPLPHRMLDQLKRRPPDFTVKFTEDKEGFYINHRKFAPDDEPMIRIKVGTRAHWRVTNATDEIHPRPRRLILICTTS